MFAVGIKARRNVRQRVERKSNLEGLNGFRWNTQMKQKKPFSKMIQSTDPHSFAHFFPGQRLKDLKMFFYSHKKKI